MLLQIFILIVLMVVFIYLSGFFSGTETAITNLDMLQIAELRKKKSKNIEYIIKLKKDMDKTLITLLIGNNVVNIILSAITALISHSIFETIGVTIMVGILAFLIIIFGEITPKSKALLHSQEIAINNSKYIYYLSQFFQPIIPFLISFSEYIIRLSGYKKKQKSIFLSENEIKNLAILGESEGEIKDIEKDIIHKVFRFGDSTIEDIMVPMNKVFCFKTNYTIEQAAKLIARHGFTRVPVVNQKNKVTGIFYTKDIINQKRGRVNNFTRTPFFVSPDNDITDIFKIMKKKRIHMAIVKDNFGNHIGIVTLEDILEELVGEIYDEYAEIKYRNGSANED